MHGNLLKSQARRIGRYRALIQQLESRNNRVLTVKTHRAESRQSSGETTSHRESNDCDSNRAGYPELLLKDERSRRGRLYAHVDAILVIPNRLKSTPRSEERGCSPWQCSQQSGLNACYNATTLELCFATGEPATSNRTDSSRYSEEYSKSAEDCLVTAVFR